jgi:anthranilate/para-aminobenzoate synthase component II
MPDVLEATAWSDDGLIMAMRHKAFPVEGVQFHPESVGTPAGRALLRNFLDTAGVATVGVHA